MPAESQSTLLPDSAALFATLKRWPHVFTVPLLMCGLALSAFFTGTNTFWYAPPLICLFIVAGVIFVPGFRHGWQWPRSATVTGIVLFGLYVVLSTLWSQVPYISTLFAFVLGSLPLLFLVLICSPDPARAVRLHGMGAFIVIGGFALWALVQFFFLFEEYGPRIHHPMLSPNSLAALFIIGLFMALSLFFHAQSRKALWGGYILAALLLLALMVTQSRGGMIAAAVSVLVFLFFIRGAGGFNGLKIGTLLATLMAAAVTVDYFSGGRFENNLSALGSAVTNQSYIDRILLLQSALEMIRDHFWAGIGLGTFYFTYPSYRDPQDSSDGYFVHMDPLQYGVEMGILAPLIFYGVLIAILCRTVAAMRKLPPGDGRRYHIMAPFCALLAVTMHTHMDFHLYILVTLMAMAFPLAWWYVATEEVLQDRRRFVAPPPVRPFLSSGIAVFVLVILAVWPVRAALSTHMMTVPQQALARNDVAAAEAALDKIALFVPRSSYMYELYRARVATQALINRKDELTEEEARALYRQALDHFNRGQALNADFSAIPRDRAKLYIAVDDWLIADGSRKAQEELRAVIARNPMEWEARLLLARIYDRQGNLPAALDVLESGMRWPMLRGVITVKILVLQSQYHQRLGNEARARAAMQRAQNMAESIGMIVKKGGAAEN